MTTAILKREFFKIREKKERRKERDDGPTTTLCDF